MNKAIHRWQLTGQTPCGRDISRVNTNLGYILNDGVTCKSCRSATTFWSDPRERWNGEIAEGVSLSRSYTFRFDGKGYRLEVR